MGIYSPLMLLFQIWKQEENFQNFSSGMIDEHRPERKTNLQSLLDERELTHRELSSLTGITERTIHDLVKGVSLPRLDRAVAIAKALGISLKQLCIELGLDVEGLPDDGGDA